MILLKWLYISNFLIIVIKYMFLRNSMLIAKKNGLLNLEIKGDSKIAIDCYNKKITIHSSIFFY